MIIMIIMMLLVCIVLSNLDLLLEHILIDKMMQDKEHHCWYKNHLHCSRDPSTHCIWNRGCGTFPCRKDTRTLGWIRQARWQRNPKHSTLKELKNNWGSSLSKNSRGMKSCWVMRVGTDPESIGQFLRCNQMILEKDWSICQARRECLRIICCCQSIEQSAGRHCQSESEWQS